MSPFEKSEQLKRYLRGLSGRKNLILTDHLEFRWYVDGILDREVRIGEIASKNRLGFDEDGLADH